jgi:peptidyl-prolyl cis-trans isomerase B (cyclophilin B)
MKRALLIAAATSMASLAGAQEPESGAPAGPRVRVETELGAFVVRLLPEVAPGHVGHFLERARSGGYDGTTFHRLVPGSVVQGGDPISKDPEREAEYGRGGFGLLKAEISARGFVRGAVVAARCPSDLDSDGDQFFVLLDDEPALQGHYTIFGEVVSGWEVLDALGAAGTDEGRPRRRIEMRVSIEP